MTTLTYFRNFLLTAVVLSLGLTASAESLSQGQMVTVRVSTEQPATRATLDLGEDLTGLELQRDHGVWTGSFALLPGMVEPILRPEIHLFDASGHSLNQEQAQVELAASEFDRATLSTVLEDPETVFAFGNDIVAGTISYRIGDGDISVRPVLGKNIFTLPEELRPDEVVVISAEQRDGERVVFGPTWDVDTANLEEEL